MSEKQGCWRIHKKTQELLKESLKSEIVRRGGEIVSMAEWIDILVKAGLAAKKLNIKPESD